MPIKESWWSIKTLSERWKVSKERILEIASSGALTVSVYFEGELHKCAGAFLSSNLKLINNTHGKPDDIDERMKWLEQYAVRRSKTIEGLERRGMSEEEIFLHFESLEKKNKFVNILASDAIRFIGGRPVEIEVVFKRNAEGKVVFYTPKDRDSEGRPVFTIDDIIVTSSELKQHGKIDVIPDDGRPKLSGIIGICRFYFENIKQKPFPEHRKAKDFNEWKTIRPKLKERGFLMEVDPPWTTPLAMETVYFKGK